MPVVTLSGRLIHLHQVATNFFVGSVRAVFWPKAELLMRLWIARIFIGSAMVKLADWQTALQLSAHEYPLGSLSAVAETYLGVSLELVAGSLLAVGAFTRLASVALFCLSLTIQITYKPFDDQLVWMALFAWYAVSGAGLLSLDQLLSRGLRGSALPGMARSFAFIDFVTAHLKPLVLSLIRVWIAVALLSTTSAWGRALIAAEPALTLWIPTSMTSTLPAVLAMAGGMLLLVGFATRYVAAAVFIALLAGSMLAGRMLDTTYVFMVFAIFFLDGAGWLSLDRALSEYFERRFARLLNRDLHADPAVPRVVVVGSGFGGLSCVQGLRNTRVAVTLIDRTNYQLFQPLLYQVATAALSPADIAAPVRPIFRDMRGLRCMLGTVTGVDTAAREVILSSKRVRYDYLVLATGAAHSYFGNERWAAVAPGLKRMENALDIRRRVLTAFELAESAIAADERQALLTFVIVGGGPTGVELAGAIAELAKYGMSREFRTFNPASARIILVQSGPVVLPAFAQSLSKIALASLSALGVEVMLGSRVEEIDADGVRVSGVEIRAKTVLWAAGVSASPAAAWLNTARDGAGRILVGADLRVPGLVNTFAVGDTSLSNAWQGKAVPGLAPAAKQGGAYVAQVITAEIEGRAAVAPFRYRHRGSLATIGRKAAVADFGFVRLWGAPAWWLWGLIHVGFLVGARNRASTLMNWFWAYLTFGASARLTSLDEAEEATPGVEGMPIISR